MTAENPDNPGDDGTDDNIFGLNSVILVRIVPACFMLPALFTRLVPVQRRFGVRFSIGRRFPLLREAQGRQSRIGITW